MADNASERMRSVSYGKANDLVGHPPWVHVTVPFEASDFCLVSINNKQLVLI